MHLRSLLLALIVLPLASCATIFTGSSEVISVTSEPSGAEVSVRTTAGVQIQTLVTPGSVELKKGRAYVFEARLAGYRPTSAMLDTAFQPWFLGNIICGGIIGIVIDIVTGAYTKFSSDSIFIRLESGHP